MSVLDRALALRRADPFGQFGQANDALSNNGATGCTDTCMQFLADLVKSVRYTHDQIRLRVGHRNKLTGLNASEVGSWFRSVGLPYATKFNLTADQMLSLSLSRGPLLVAEMYRLHPEWKGYRYKGLVGDGKPGGFARPLALAGANQIGWDGRHAILLLGYTDADTVYVMEPNHASPARPQKVAYDIITVVQFRALVAAWKSSVGNTYCAYPTTKLS